jgi:tRNA-specific 2-thiouridylase
MASVAVAMSGGVDSSVAAALLVDEGCDVVGVTMRLTAEDTAPARAAEVCRALDIEHTVVDLREDFERSVIGPFASDYAQARTPNPCVLCNDLVKFGILLERVLATGAGALASGHYARIVRREGSYMLARPADSHKDQTYFLYRVGRARLARLVFPLGDITKDRVRAHANALGLPAGDHRESQEACFAHGACHIGLVIARHPGAAEAGPIVTEDGTVVGTHEGIAGLTVGQRRGLGVSGSAPAYVLEIRPDDRTVVVGPRERLAKTIIEARDVRWHSPRREGRCEFRFRHGTGTQAGTFVVEGDRLIVEGDQAVQGVAPGQALVCYKEDAVLGGGTIEGAS